MIPPIKIRIVDGQLRLGSLFALLWKGYIVGGLCVFAPFFLLAWLGMIIAIAAGNADGEAISGAIMMPLMLPLVLAMQGLMIAGMILLGVWIYRRVVGLEVETGGSNVQKTEAGNSDL